MHRVSQAGKLARPIKLLQGEIINRQGFAALTPMCHFISL
jgi:hypothetical protein